MRGYLFRGKFIRDKNTRTQDNKTGINKHLSVFRNKKLKPLHKYRPSKYKMGDFSIKVLIEGYSYMDESSQYRATGTSTLVIGPVNILIDTGGPWDKTKLLKALDESKITPDDIGFLVCTHGHSDHVGNLNLFLNAKHIVGFDINQGDNYYDYDFKGGQSYHLYEDQVMVIPTPGHMHNDVSVIIHKVPGFGTVAVCGDLFENEEDGDSWKEFSEWPEEQLKNREKIKVLADYIVPGHGPMFKVSKGDI